MGSSNLPEFYEKILHYRDQARRVNEKKKEDVDVGLGSTGNLNTVVVVDKKRSGR